MGLVGGEMGVAFSALVVASEGCPMACGNRPCYFCRDWLPLVSLLAVFMCTENWASSLHGRKVKEIVPGPTVLEGGAAVPPWGFLGRTRLMATVTLFTVHNRTLLYIMPTFLLKFLRGKIRMRIIHGHNDLIPWV